MKIKFIAVIALAIMLAVRMASAQSTLTQSYLPGLIIPEGNPVGVVDREYFNVAQSGDEVANIEVNLQLAGGYNGDLYVSLVAPDGTTAVLLDKPGVAVDSFGATGAGMNIRLSGDGSRAIQNETSAILLTGTYQPVDLLTVFQGAAVEGTWTLYCANLGLDDGPTTLVSWGINIEVLPAPEPSIIELGALATLVLIAARCR